MVKAVIMNYSKKNPRWSVMIPTYNCAIYLEQTLLSVLRQDPGEDMMQIEVVDDCSTDDDPYEVVKRIGGGRVKFFKQPINKGAVNNFNFCLERAKGEYVHILHGDDLLLHGFYDEIDFLIKHNTDCYLYATRCNFINENNEILSVSPLIETLRTVSKNNTSMFYTTPIQFASVVLRRSFYNQNEKFDTSLIHTADVDMWARVIFKGGGIVSPHIFSSYRIFLGNDSSKLERSADNLKDLLRLCEKFDVLYPKFNRIIFMNMLYSKAINQYIKYLKINDILAMAEIEKVILYNFNFIIKMRFYYTKYRNKLQLI